MRRVSRSAVVPFSARQMFDLVDDIDSYPEFLPWCGDAEVHSREGDTVRASIEMRRAGLSRWFRTRNTVTPGERIDIALEEGPFRKLQGVWRFSDIDAGQSRVSLDLEFAFDNRLADMLLGPFFQEISQSLVDAFVRRARALYGSHVRA